MLWLAVLKELEHIAPASDPAIRCRRATCPETEERLKRGHRLTAAVVAEHELVEVRLQLRAADAVMRGNEPILKIANDAIGERDDRAGTLAERRGRRLLQRDVTIARCLQANERRQPIGVNRRPSRDGFLHDPRHRRSREVRQHRKTDPARPVFATFDRDKYRNRPAAFQLPAPRDASLRPANPGVIDLDIAMQRLSRGIDHRAPQLMEHHPRRFVTPQTELPLDPQRRGAALIGRHQVRGPEPLDEWRLRVVKNCPGGQRNLVSALGTLPTSIGDRIRPPMTTPRTDETVRPATRRQILLTGLLGSELTAELVQRFREGRARHPPTLQIVAG